MDKPFFDRIVHGGESAIDDIITQRIPESVYLEYKQKSHPDSESIDNADRKNLGSEISAFANTMGGVIIWGIRTKNIGGDDVPVEKKPISKIDSFERMIRNLVSNYTSPQIFDYKIDTVKCSDNSESGFLLIWVGRSELRPHMSLAKDDFRYYKRDFSNTKSMLHHEVEEMLLRNRRSDMELSWHLEDFRAPKADLSQDTFISFKLSINIFNSGSVSGSYPSIRIENSSFTEDLVRLHVPFVCRNRIPHMQVYSNDHTIVHPGDYISVFYIDYRVRQRPRRNWAQVGRRFDDPPRLAFDFTLFAVNTAGIKGRFELLPEAIIEEIEVLCSSMD